LVALLEEDNYNDPDIVPNESHESLKSASIFLICFCFLAFLLLIPLLYVQIVNLILGSTTHERFAFQGKNIGNSDQLGNSYMLLTEEEQMISVFSGFTNPSNIIQETQTYCYCFHRKIASSYVSELEKISNKSIQKEDT
jgi:hypothetical protein